MLTAACMCGYRNQRHAKWCPAGDPTRRPAFHYTSLLACLIVGLVMWVGILVVGQHVMCNAWDDRLTYCAGPT